MGDIIKEWGLKLLLTKIKIAGGAEEFFKQTQIKHWNLQDNTTHCLKVYKDVLWMILLEQSEGMKLPNKCRIPIYVEFYRPIKYYRFRNLVPKSDYVIANMDEFIKSRVWSYHDFRIKL